MKGRESELKCLVEQPKMQKECWGIRWRQFYSYFKTGRKESKSWGERFCVLRECVHLHVCLESRRWEDGAEDECLIEMHINKKTCTSASKNRFKWYEKQGGHRLCVCAHNRTSLGVRNQTRLWQRKETVESERSNEGTINEKKIFIKRTRCKIYKAVRC